MESIDCPFCKEKMVQHKLRGDTFWECPTCRCEVWPYNERLGRKQIRDLMRPPVKAKKGDGRRKKRFKTRKPGEKFVPWYQRGL